MAEDGDVFGAGYDARHSAGHWARSIAGDGD